jgi:hypothetical protein
VSSNQQTSPPTTPTPARGFEALAVYHRQIPLIVLGVGVLLAAIPLANFAVNDWSFKAPAVFIWGAALCVFVMIAGIAASVPRPGPVDLRAEADRLRILFLALAGGVGFATALLGLLLPFTDAYREKFAGGLEVWRQNPWILVRCGVALFGGLALMFAGLQLARSFERTQPSLRRLLYGYNAVLGSLLLLSVLGLFNVLAYVHLKPFSYLSQTFDWTSSGLYTLSDQDRGFLANELKEPVEVVVIMPGNDLLTSEMETLLNNCRAITPLITWRISSRDINRSEFAQLAEKYALSGDLGVLVLYGKEPNITSEFIKRNDLFETKGGFGAEEQTRFTFKGESALLNAIRYLNEGKAKATIYFTQGHDELKLDEMSNEFDQGIGMLKGDLEKTNYQVKPLLLDRDTKAIPEDADVVVVARPLQTLEANAVKVLRDYLQGAGRKNKGRLFVLLDATPDRGGNQVQTGLEGLLAEYNVKVGNDRILCLREAAEGHDPLMLPGVVTNRRSANPIARAFAPENARSTPFLFYDARTVAAGSANPGMPARANAEELMLVPANLLIWAETDLKASPTALARDLLKNQDLLEKKLSRVSLPVAVAVTEGGPTMMPPGHPNVGSESEPRLIVVGDASWITNRILNARSPYHLDLFTSCVSWLRGKTTSVGTSATGVDRQSFHLKTESSWRLVLLPIGLMVVAVLVLGSGVWVVRRR